MSSSNYVINNYCTIIEFLNYLNKNDYSYVWLHGYHNERLGDIDIAVDRLSFEDIEKIICNFDNNFKIVQILQHEYCAKYFVLGKITDNVIEYLIPDICSHYVRNGRVLIRSERLLDGSVFNGQFYHCNSLIEAEYVFLKRTLKKKWEISHFNDFKNIYDSNKKECEKFLNKYLSKSLRRKFISNIEKNDITSLNNLMENAYKSILIKTLIANPTQYFYYKWNDLLRIIKRIIKPTGLFIAVVGTDGSGKSTIINSLIKALAPPFRRTSIHHWKPKIFNESNPKNFVVTEPHKAAPRSFIISLIKLIVYIWQYLFGYFMKIYPMKIRSTLIVFDRYYYDMIVDQRRFRLKIPKKFIQLFSNLVPKPDLVFYLKTKPSIALQRKNELDLGELKRQNKEFASLKNVLNNRFYVINNDGDVETTVNEIISVVFNFLEKRLNIK